MLSCPHCTLLFQLATKAVSYFIEHFGMRDLFGRDNYEYYARLTGRILKVEVGTLSKCLMGDTIDAFNRNICMKLYYVKPRTSGYSSRTRWTISA